MPRDVPLRNQCPEPDESVRFADRTAPVTAVLPAALPAAAGLDDDSRAAFARDGYLRLSGIAEPTVLDGMRAVYDEAWAAGESGTTERLHLLRHQAFRDFVDSPSVLAVPRSLFGHHLQLLDLWQTFQPAASRWRKRAYTVPTDRDWHRDVTYLGTDPARPLIVNMLLFLDDVDERTGPTVVLPGSHRARAAAVSEHSTEVHPEEVAVPLARGDALLFNSSLVHSRGRNRSGRARRAVALMWGYWFIKPIGTELPLCPGATEGAAEERLRLIGVAQPTVDQYLFDPF